MITKVGEKDHFGYDDSGRPVAAQIAPGVVAFGYNFCDRLRKGLSIGFEVSHRLYADGGAILAIYSPAANAAEVWQCRWKIDKGRYNLIEPAYVGIAKHKFTTIDALNSLLASDLRIELVPGYLNLEEDKQDKLAPPSFVIADQQFSMLLQSAPNPFNEVRSNRGIITDTYSDQ